MALPGEHKGRWRSRRMMSRRVVDGDILKAIASDHGGEEQGVLQPPCMKLAAVSVGGLKMRLKLLFNSIGSELTSNT